MLDIERRLRGEATRDGIAALVVGAIVHHGDRVLILRRSASDDFLPGIEELPSGGVEDGEGLFGALARELAEEIGRRGPLRLDPGFVASFDYVSGSGRATRQYTFALAAEDRAVTLSEEHEGHRWVDPADLTGTGLTDETARTIRTWVAAQ